MNTCTIDLSVRRNGKENKLRSLKSLSAALLVYMLQYEYMNSVKTFADVYCNDPPSVDSSTVEGLSARDPLTGLFAYGSVVKYDCLNGRRTEDGRTTAYVQCVLSGVWNQPQISCDCRSSVFKLKVLIAYYGIGRPLAYKTQRLQY